jgi:hypothetical protein
MKDIYTQAHEVLVWLGDDEATSQLLSRLERDSWPHDCWGSSLRALFENSYWQRMWPVQEVAVATRVRIFSRDKYLRWQILEALMYYIERDDETDHETTIGTPLAADGFESIKSLIELRKRCVHDNDPIGLTDALHITRTRHATDELDKVYSLLGLAFDSQSFIPTPQYGIKLDELFRRMTERYITRTGNLNTIFLAGRRAECDLPSWVPCWTNLEGVNANRWISHVIRGGSRGDGNLPRVDGHTLVVRGEEIDTIDGLCSPVLPLGFRCLRPIPSTAKHKNSDLKGEHITRAIIAALFYGVYLEGNTIIIDRDLEDCKRVVVENLSNWLAENESVRIHGKPLSHWVRVTRSTRIRTFGHYAMETLKFIPFILAAVFGVGQVVLRILDHKEDFKNRHIDELVGMFDKGLETLEATSMRLIVTTNGMVGVAPVIARKGYIIAQLTGCDRPVVLEQFSESPPRWKIVGDAWLYSSQTKRPPIFREYQID